MTSGVHDFADVSERVGEFVPEVNLLRVFKQTKRNSLHVT